MIVDQRFFAKSLSSWEAPSRQVVLRLFCLLADFVSARLSEIFSVTAFKQIQIRIPPTREFCSIQPARKHDGRAALVCQESKLIRGAPDWFSCWQSVKLNRLNEISSVTALQIQIGLLLARQFGSIQSL